MKHLTDEQLGARLDGELPPKQAEAAERHLAGCAACRERLAALSLADASLERALEHDPGEQYFASFADRVQARLASGAGAGEAPAPRPARGWLQRPSTLAWAGAAAAVVVVGAFAIQIAMQQVAGEGSVPARRSIAGADRLERAAGPSAPAGAGAPAAESRPSPAAGTNAGPAAPAPSAAPATGGADLAQGAAPAAPPSSAPAAPQRMQELRTLPNGEQVPVQTRALPRAQASRDFAAPPGEAARPPKPSAMPLAPAPAGTSKHAVPPEAASQGALAQERRLAPPASAPAPAPLAVQSNEAESPALRADEAGTFRLCGRVTDTAGRALANATVTVVETGRSVSSGPDGGFCVDAPAARATLSVLSVGYHEHRAVLHAGDAAGQVAVALSPVSALGEGGAPVARFKVPAPQPATSETAGGAAREERALAQAMKSAGTLGAVSIPALPGETAQARTAREASEAALRLRTPAAWSKAGALWDGVAAGAGLDAAGHEARYRAAEARMNAWRLVRDDSNRRAAAAAVDACLAHAPAGQQRATAEKWSKELSGR